MKTISAATETGIRESLSNFMPGCNNGWQEATAEFKRVINGQPLDAERICKALNAHRWTTDKFEPCRNVINGILIKATDCWGNKHLIKVTE